MKQLTVKKLRDSLAKMPDDLPVFFRRCSPAVVGITIEEAGKASRTKFSAFGVLHHCVIIEPITD